MGKIFVLSVTDHEEYILSRIMEIIAAEPGFDHIVSSHPCNTLVFPGLELRLKERTVHRNGELISMTRREFATLVYLAKHPSWVFSAGQIYEEVWGGRWRKLWNGCCQRHWSDPQKTDSGYAESGLYSYCSGERIQI